MFEPRIYQARRAALQARFGSGVLLLPGNADAPMNYRDNIFPFVQDGTFRYFFGLNEPDLVGVIDVDAGEVLLFGNDPGLDTVIWTGPLPSLTERAALVGVETVRPMDALADWLGAAVRQGRSIHYTPPYRGETVLQLAALLGRTPQEIRAGASEALVRAIVPLREIKGPEEVAEIERALEVTAEMHLAAMRASRPGVYEQEVAGEMEGIVRRRNRQNAYPIILTRQGQYLHHHSQGQRLEAGDLVVNDSGATSELGYASDITRTLPVGGRFSERQRALYDIVLRAQLAAIDAMRPGVPFLEIHKLAARVQVEGLKEFGLFKGDPVEVVESGAYALCFQCGTGHQLGLDVHDMEALGENLVGYDDEIHRSSLFGMRKLRMGKRLRPGMVITVEPGLYFIRELIETWRSEGRHTQFIDYERFERFADFGGIRIEDNILVTEQGTRVLGPAIPKAADEVEAAMGR